MPKIKVLYFSHSADLYGAESCLISLVTSLDKERFESIVIFPSDGQVRQYLDGLGFKTYIVPTEWWVKNQGLFLFPQNELLQRIDQLLRIVDEERPDIIHSNTSVIWAGAVAARILGIRHIWHLHEMLTDHPTLEPALPLPLLYQAVNFLSDRVVPVSYELQKELVGYVSPEKLQVIYNGVSVSATDSRQTFREEIAAGAERIISMTVSSLWKYKGIEHLLDAAALVAKTHPEALFVVAGTGPREAVDSFNHRVKELGLEESVRYLGFRNDVPRLLASADLFVLPSLKEAFPLVVLEAMACGKPVIATDCGGTREMILDGETGFVVPVNDPAALAEKVIDLCKNSTKRAELGRKGAERFQDNFTLEKHTKQFEELYAEVAVSPGPKLSAKEESLLTSILKAYQDYIRAIRTLSDREKEITSLSHQLDEKNHWLTLRSSELEQLKENATVREKQQDEQARHLTGLLQQKTILLAAAEDDNFRISAENEANKLLFEHQLREKEQRLEDLLKSKSWKITSPLRAALELFKKSK